MSAPMPIGDPLTGHPADPPVQGMWLACFAPGPTPVRGLFATANPGGVASPRDRRHAYAEYVPAGDGKFRQASGRFEYYFKLINIMANK